MQKVHPEQLGYFLGKNKNRSILIFSYNLRIYFAGYQEKSFYRYINTTLNIYFRFFYLL